MERCELISTVAAVVFVAVVLAMLAWQPVRNLIRAVRWRLQLKGGEQAMYVNHVVLMGNLTRDPELRYTSGGSAVCQFGLGLNRRYTNGAGQVQEERCFVEVVAWGKQAEATAAHMSKGRAVFVEGRLQQESWETEAGERRSRLKVVAQRVTFLPRPGTPQAEGEPMPDWVTEEG